MTAFGGSYGGKTPSVSVFQGTNPNAGAEVSQIVPSDEIWELIAMRVQLVTSAVVANRRPVLSFDDDGLTAFCRCVSPTDHVASTTIDYNFIANGSPSVATVGQDATVAIPRLILPPGFRIRTVTSGFDVGDNWGAPRIAIIKYR